VPENGAGEGQEEKDPTHAAMYGVKLAERLRDAGVEAVLTYSRPRNEIRIDDKLHHREAGG
jgi:hypothetical protein